MEIETAEVETEKTTRGYQQKRGVTERATVATDGGKRREAERGVPQEVVDGARQPDWLPYVPLTWRQLQRKTWLLTVFFPDREWTEELNALVQKLIQYLREPDNTSRLLIGMERCPRTGRLHAHIYIDFMRTMRMSRRLCNIQLPGEDFVLHPHVASLSGNNGEIQVILYILKKETKIKGVS